VNFILIGDIYEAFTYKLATYLSTSDVAGLQNAIFRGSCKVTRVCSGTLGSYKVRYRARVSFLAVRRCS